VDHRSFQSAILALIAANAVTLGLETVPSLMAVAGVWIARFDAFALGVFCVELALRMTAHGRRFFRDPWSVFDLAVVTVALLPATGPLAVLRALRVLRVLRLVSAVPSMRRVVAGLLGALPGLSSILGLMALVFYVAAVIATKLFGATFPEWFGSIPASAYSLFQIMTLESWSMGIVRPVMDVHPWAWVFFVPFILTVTFTMLNLFIAVIVGAMQAEHDAAREADDAAARDERAVILEELRALRDELVTLRVAPPPLPPLPAGSPAGQPDRSSRGSTKRSATHCG
jgi:voltage-gated sodium channel